jgi:hypothetical protein
MHSGTAKQIGFPRETAALAAAGSPCYKARAKIPPPKDCICARLR